MQPSKEELETLYNSYDDDGNEDLDEKEVSKMIKDMLTAEKNKLEEAFKKAPRNKADELESKIEDLEETINALEGILGKQTHAELTKIFDMDGDKKIDKAEFVEKGHEAMQAVLKIADGTLTASSPMTRGHRGSVANMKCDDDSEGIEPQVDA